MRSARVTVDYAENIRDFGPQVCARAREPAAAAAPVGVEQSGSRIVVLGRSSSRGAYEK
jgi:hypothetical protein